MKTAILKYKKKLEKQIKKIWKNLPKHKKAYIFGSILLFFVLIGLSLVLIFRTKPNDDIFVLNSNEPYLYANENPNFSVDFGLKEDPDKQWVRFEAQPSTENPFSDEEASFFTKVWNTIVPPKDLGIEMSMVGVGVNETNSNGEEILNDEAKSVADILGTENIQTSTELVEIGREIGDYEDDQIISKETIVNQNVGNGIDLEYQILAGVGVKEEIVLRNLDSFSEDCISDISKCAIPLNQYTFELKLDEGVVLQSGWYTVEGTSREAYYFTDDDGNYISHFLPSFALDNYGSKTYDVDLKVESTDEQNVYRIVVTVDLEWLLSSERSFPIRIDPSIVHDDQADFDAGVFYNTESNTTPEVTLENREAVITSDTLSYWQFEEESGSGAYLLDSSGNGYHATPSGTTYSQHAFVDSGRSFNGTSDYVTTPWGSGYNVGTSDLTISMWVQTDSPTTNQMFMASGATTPRAYFGIYGGSWDMGINASGWDATIDKVPTTDWTYVTIVFDSASNTAIFYINGEVNNSKTYADYSLVSNWTIGAYGNQTQYFWDGNIDDVKLDTAAFSQKQVQEAYAKGIGRYSGEYISDELDLGGNVSVENFEWTKSGVNTGDGEAPYSTTGLVGMWNFNETSGTTADNEGSCGASCDGTLSGMTTTGQDVVAGSGWTSDNRKWGDGALMFDGTNDSVTANVGALSSFTIAGWFKQDVIGNQKWVSISESDNTLVTWIGSGNSGINNTWDCGVNALDVNDIAITGSSWGYYTLVYDGNVGKCYKDGNLVGTTETTSISYINAKIAIGKRAWADSGHYNGTIDSVSLYSRALTESEIQSNYQAGNIEFQYRYSTDGSTWSDWGGGTETSIDDMENPYLYDPTETGLVAYFPMNESSGTSVEDVSGVNEGTATGTRVFEGIDGNARDFNGTSEYITVGNDSSLNLSTTDFTLEAWIKVDSFSAFGEIIGKGINTDYEIMTTNTGKIRFLVEDGGTNKEFDSNTTLSVGRWYHIVGVKTGTDTTGKIYINGKLDRTYTSFGDTSTNSSSNSVIIGARSTGTPALFFNGMIDEAKIYNTALTSAQVYDNYIAGYNVTQKIHTSNSIFSIEGDNSKQITSSTYIDSASTLAHWSLNESSGSGAYIKNSVSSSYNGTPVGTTFANDGLSGGGRYFDGVDDYISIGNTGQNVYYFSFWVKSENNINASTGLGGPAVTFVDDPNTHNGDKWINVGGGATGACTNEVITLMDTLTGQRTCLESTTMNLVANVWHNIAISWSGSLYYIYVDGVRYSTTQGSASSNVLLMNATNLKFGMKTSTPEYSDGYAKMTLDTVTMGSAARTAEQISDNYRQGMNERLSFSASSVDLAGNTMLPFWVASDVLGANMEVTYGENLYVNQLPDTNTVGLWYMDEVIDNSCDGGEDVCDSASSLDANVSGTSIVNGKSGEARYFDGADDYITMGDIAYMDAASVFTVSLWFNRMSDNSGTDNDTNHLINNVLFAQSDNGQNDNLELGTEGSNLEIYLDTGSDIAGSDGGNITAGIRNGLWYNVVLVYDSSASNELNIYLNGESIYQSSTPSGSLNSSVGSPFSLGIARAGSDNWGDFNGTIDNFRIDSVARTQEEIRSSYESNQRTHQITVNFKANLQSSNLILSSADTSFTISEIPYGKTDEIENLNKGDKIVIKENYDGTEYIAQGYVSSVDTDTGAVTVSSWDAESTFPASGFTAGAIAFKWQKEYIDIRNVLPEFKDGVSLLTFKKLTNKGATFWIDDISTATYLTDDTGATFTEIEDIAYFQYKAIFTTTDTDIYPSLLQVTTDYTASGPTLDQLMRHGQWFDSSGTKQGFWWVGNN